MQEIQFTVHVFREGDTYVAHAPELDVSTCGDTADRARENIRDAVRGFLEAAAESGTLEQILHEAGYQRGPNGWEPNEFVSIGRMAVGF